MILNHLAYNKTTLPNYTSQINSVCCVEYPPPPQKKSKNKKTELPNNLLQLSNKLINKTTQLNLWQAQGFVHYLDFNVK